MLNRLRIAVPGKVRTSNWTLCERRPRCCSRRLLGALHCLLHSRVIWLPTCTTPRNYVYVPAVRYPIGEPARANRDHTAQRPGVWMLECVGRCIRLACVWCGLDGDAWMGEPGGGSWRGTGWISLLDVCQGMSKKRMDHISNQCLIQLSNHPT